MELAEILLEPISGSSARALPNNLEILTERNNIMLTHKTILTALALGTLVLSSVPANAGSGRNTDGGFSREIGNQVRSGGMQSGSGDWQSSERGDWARDGRIDDRQYDRQDRRQDHRQNHRQDDRRDDRKDDRWEDLRHAYWRNRVIHRLLALPTHRVVVVYDTQDYHYVDGEYYIFVDGHYVLIDPPSGLMVRALPIGYESLVVYGVPHYYYGGVYYRAHNHGYVVVRF